MGRNREYESVVRLIGDVIFTQSDEDPGKKIQTQIVARDKKYTELLNAYTRITKARFWLKEIHKWFFFWLVIAASVVCLSVSYNLINKVLKEDSVQVIIDAVPAILAAFTAFVSTVIAVPLTITQFLFNTKEDDNITTLIQHTQDHDVSGINMLKERFSKKTDIGRRGVGQMNQQPFEEVSGD